MVALDVFWQVVVKGVDIKEAIVRGERRMLYFNQSLFNVGSWNGAFVFPFPLLDVVRHNV